MTTATAPLPGSIHRFGRDGVLYEVVRVLDKTTAIIRVLETGEETSYLLSEILQDPTE